MAFEHFENGGSMESFSSYMFRKLGVKVSTRSIYNWIKQYPEFALDIEVGKSDYKRQLENIVRADVIAHARELKEGLRPKRQDR